MKPSEPRQVMRFEYELPEGQQFSALELPVRFRPMAGNSSTAQPMGFTYAPSTNWTAKLIAGTEGSTQQPFFSPDGKWIGYFSVTDRQLKKIAINGGAPVTLCGSMQLVGAWWSRDNSIVYGQLPGSGIMRISANGGTPEAITKPRSEIHAMPQILPDGKIGALFFLRQPHSKQDYGAVAQSGEPKELFAGTAPHISQPDT